MDTTVKRGDIFYADLSPVVGSEQGGTRPVLIVQNDTGNRHSPTVIAAAITSQTGKARLPTHINIAGGSVGLTKDSVILLEQIRTIDKRRLREHMGKLDDTGVYQLKGGNWAYRYTITENGRKKDVRKAKDEFGNPLKTKTEAIRARNKALEQEREGKKPTPKARRTVKEVYAEFCENGREDRAYRTKQKQDCL